MRALSGSLLLLLPLLTVLPHVTSTVPASTSSRIRPLIIWHGLGDTYTSPGMGRLSDLYTILFPQSPVHVISISPSASGDRRSTFLGHVPTQVALVCEQLLSLPPPFSTHRLNFLGLSQGSQFIRALIQSCAFPLPPRTLVTLGGQHNGITQFLPDCAPSDWVCKSTSSLLNSNKWSSWSQTNLVPAQYFRDPADLDSYRAHSSFLAPFNNEIPKLRNETYAKNLARLDAFVMYIFENDTTVIPKHSGWFDDLDPHTGKLIALRDSPLYAHDWLGLKELDHNGALWFDTVPGNHMELPDEVMVGVYLKWFAPTKPSPAAPEDAMGDEL